MAKDLTTSVIDRQNILNNPFAIQGEDLQEFKLACGSEIDFATKTTVLGIFDFRSFLNLGMQGGYHKCPSTTY